MSNFAVGNNYAQTSFVIVTIATMINRQKQYLPNNTLRELVRDNNMLLMVVSRFNIPFGFGDMTVAQVCHANAIDTDTFLAVCNLLSFGNADYESVSLSSLMTYLKCAHAAFLEISLPRIRKHLIEDIDYRSDNRVSFMLVKFFDDYVAEVEHHMSHENGEVFGYIEHLLAGERDLANTISDFSANHGHMASKLQELKDLFIYHYSQPDNPRLSSVLFDIIMCEKDMMAHFEVENRLLIPAVEKLESNVKRKPISTADKDEKSSQSQTFMLGEREKDILRCIAKGKSNKEIADELCISVHTVTTHRRNICAKLNIHSAAGLAIFAIIHNLVKIEDVNPIKD